MLNEWDQSLHDQIHKTMLEKEPKNLLKNSRLRVLDNLNDNLRSKIKGIIADIGCGSGYFGIGLAKKFPNISRIDCIEASKFAVNELIPRNIKYYNVEECVKPVFGSFDNLGNETYDIIFAMGALHHSRNLNKTLSSIFNALKPDGMLIAQEPSMPDETTHFNYQVKYNIVEEKIGFQIRNGDRFDRFFRECEYKYNLVMNGFDILLWEDFELNKKSKSKIQLAKNYLIKNGYKKTLFKLYNYFFKIKNKNNETNDKEWKKEMDKAISKLTPKLFVAKKSDCENIYHDKP